MIGVVGGMGPHAGALFLERLTALNPEARRDQDHPRVLLYSNSQVPNRVEALVGDGPSPVPEMLASLDLLSRGGASFAAIACNTAHAYLDELRAGAPLPVLDMITAAARHLARRGVRRIALLATEGTVSSGIYQRALHAEGIAALAPDRGMQDIISSAIYDPEHGIKARSSPLSPGMLDTLAAVSRDLLRVTDAERLLIACTDLSVAFRDPSLAALTVIDSLDTLALECLSHARSMTPADLLPSPSMLD